MFLAWSPTRSRSRGDEKQLEIIRDAIRLIRHLCGQVVGDVVIHLVDLPVAGGQGASQLGIAIDIGPDAVAENGAERAEGDRFVQFRFHR
jgi:hypothetical protein